MTQHFRRAWIGAVAAAAIHTLAGCASPKRATCTVQSDCSPGAYCDEAEADGRRFCNFDCKVASDCVGMTDAVCSEHGRCEVAGAIGDGGLADDDGGGGGGDGGIVVDGGTTVDAASAGDAAMVDARVIDGAMPDGFVFMDAAVGCTLVPPQSGCLSTQACDLNASDQRACRPNGTQQHGQACGLGGDCIAGSICLDDSKCHQFCDPAAPVCPSSGTCSIRVTNTAGATLANACQDPAPTCSVLAQDCVVASESCAIVAGSAGAEQRCVTPGTALQGAVCPFANSCVKPLSCVKVGGDADFRCHKPCNLTDMTGCQAGQTCTTAGLGGIIGMCRPPI